jgi:GGDEF domain-containing protein
MNVILASLLFLHITTAVATELKQSEINDTLPPRTFADTCVEVCTKIINNDSEIAKSHFRKNCNAAKQEADEMSTLIGAAKAAGSITFKMAYKCAPQSVGKMATGLKDATLSFVNYMINGNPTHKAEIAARKKFLNDCERSMECKKNIARLTNRYGNTNSKGEFIESDEKVLAYIKNLSFKRLYMEMQRDQDSKRNYCEQILLEKSQFVYLTQTQKTATQQRQEIFNRINTEAPYCPGLLQLPSPALESVTVPSPKTPFDQLTTVQKMYVGWGCIGENPLPEVQKDKTSTSSDQKVQTFSDAMWDACSEAGQMLVPVPAGPIVRGVSKLVKETKGISLATKLPQGHTAISAIEGGTITRSISVEGKTTYSVVKTNGTIEPLRMDPSGYAISANNETARALAFKDMESGNKSAMFFDVNHLGLVNYFKKGSEAGDQYLGNVARIISDKIGQQGTLYRWGGDEFVVVLNSTDKNVVKKLSQDISDAIANNPSTRAIFRSEKIANAQTYKEVVKSTSYDTLPESFKGVLNPAEKKFAQENFDTFKKTFVEIENKKLFNSAAIQPSVSTGSAVIEGRSAQEALELANKGANTCKITYKTAMGMNVCKYIGREQYLPPQEKNTIPRSLKTKPIAPDPF